MNKSIEEQLKDANKKIRALKRDIKDLEESRERLMSDREKFRAHFAKRFRWWVELLGNKNGPDLQWVIKDDAKFLTKVDWWFW